jgi:hypothetical protein
MRPSAPVSWPEIHDLEVREEYPAAIDALEARLAADPEDREAVRRLGFNLWYAVAEEGRIRHPIPAKEYATRFVALYRQYADRLADDADFCWAFGLGLSLFPFHFSGATDAAGQRLIETEGNQLLDRARSLAPMWAELPRGADLSPLKGRGIFASYYNVA